jgi:hypothetical protein
MPNTATIPATCTPEDAPRMLKWLRERGGVAVWLSINLSNPGASWMSPALQENGLPTSKPNWQADTTPVRVISDPAEILVRKDKEVHRFRIALRTGSQGLSVKLTDHSSQKVHKALDKFGPEARYVFDYETQQAVILMPDGVTSLDLWAQEHPEA